MNLLLVSEHEKIRRSVFLSIEGDAVGLNCNNTLTIRQSTFSLERFYEKAVRYSVLANTGLFVQILALIYQMSFTNTQSVCDALLISTYTYNFKEHCEGINLSCCIAGNGGLIHDTLSSDNRNIHR